MKLVSFIIIITLLFSNALSYAGHLRVQMSFDEKSKKASTFDADLLNIDGARYYLWTGEELKYFYHVGEVDEDEVEISSDKYKKASYQKEVELLNEFFKENDIIFPCYIILEIPSSLENGTNIIMPNSTSFYIDRKESHVTILGDIPVTTYGFIKSNSSLAHSEIKDMREKSEANLENVVPSVTDSDL